MNGDLKFSFQRRWIGETTWTLQQFKNNTPQTPIQIEINLLGCYLFFFLTTAAFFSINEFQEESMWDKFLRFWGIRWRRQSSLQRDSSFNYCLPMSLHNVISLIRQVFLPSLGIWIRKTRSIMEFKNIGAVGWILRYISKQHCPYNNSERMQMKFNVCFSLEFEFWTTSSVNPGWILLCTMV